MNRIELWSQDLWGKHIDHHFPPRGKKPIELPSCSLKKASLSTCSLGEKNQSLSQPSLCSGTEVLAGDMAVQILATIWQWEWLHEVHSLIEKLSRNPIAQRNWRWSLPEASRPFLLVLQLKAMLLGFYSSYWRKKKSKFLVVLFLSVTRGQSFQLHGLLDFQRLQSEYPWGQGHFLYCGQYNWSV